MKRITRLLYPRLLHPQQPAAPWAPILAALLLIASAAVAMAAWRSEPVQQNSKDTTEQASQAEKSPFLRWLNEDVLYLIDDQERVAFLKLTTNEERERFVEQFWLRRDPTPDTQENEVKEEHYRRIEYANKHFRTPGGRPGWQTDRGHMYIIYGPPDEIDAHMSGTAQTPYPFEMWQYRHVEGIGDNLIVTFVDRAKSGDLRLAPGNPR